VQVRAASSNGERMDCGRHATPRAAGFIGCERF
jgi:hypothetical protein